MTSQTFGSRLRHAWNAFLNRDPPGRSSEGYSYRPDRVRLNRSNDRTIMTAINTRIAMDAAAITINHVRLDENGRYDETVDSGLNSCLNLSGNKDQTGRALRYDMFLSMLDEGCIALVPIDVDYDGKTGKTRIESMRERCWNGTRTTCGWKCTTTGPDGKRKSPCRRHRWPWWRTRSMP